MSYCIKLMDHALILLLILALLIAVHRIEARYEGFLGDLELHELEMWNEGKEEGEGEEEKIHISPMVRSYSAGRTVVNVDSLGAAGDGATDDTEAFVQAWKIACSTLNAVLLVPERRTYMVKAVRFEGPCASNLIVQISGEIVAPDEPNDWDPKNPRTWLVFSSLRNVFFQGGGVINGSGHNWWVSSCKINRTNPCRQAPTAFTIDSSSAVWVRNLNLKNSQQIHFTVSHSDVVRISELDVHAPSDSPNTDGIHVTDSTNIVIQNTKIRTGDDCISIVNGTSNIKMKNIICGPGHGISIGSLGKDNSTASVIGVVLDTAVLTGTTNGVRIKTWQGGSGYVRAVRFQNVQMNKVANPIIIDQFYCDSSTPCTNQTSAVSVSQVVYANIRGTSATPNAIKFACSDTVPCSALILANVYIQRDYGTAQTSCNSAIGSKYGLIIPFADCLQSYDRSDGNDDSDERKRGDQIIHMEL